MSGTTATVARIPDCDLCGDPAVYDGKMKRGPWAFMCEACWARQGIGRLGTGYGQRLVLAGGETNG